MFVFSLPQQKKFESKQGKGFFYLLSILKEPPYLQVKAVQLELLWQQMAPILRLMFCTADYSALTSPHRPKVPSGSKAA